MQSAIHRIPRRGRQVAAIGLAALLLTVLAACNGSSARDRGWSVQDPLWSPLPQSTAQASAAEVRAMAIARALGIPGNPSRVHRERDMLRGIDYDSIEFLSAAGDQTVMELNPETHAPISIVRLGPPKASEPAVTTAASAPGRARAIAATLGLTLPSAAPQVRWQPGLDAWEVKWGRVIDGHPVVGDGTLVDITQGGSFQAVTVTSTPAAPAPASPIPASRATEIASAFAAQKGLNKRSSFAQAAPELTWVRPNNFLDPSRSDAPEPILRLAWSVTFTYVTLAGDEPSQAVIWISAADGTLLGGNETA
ncbi:MAG: hypothetical protein ACP5VP_00160 [Candidatus Limnocylindrales bacterium]